MRDAVMERQKLLDRELGRAVQLAIDAGELSAGTDPRQVAFELIGVVLGCLRTEQIFGPDEAHGRARAAFDDVLARHAPSATSQRR
jgi:hypothetical protein